MVQESVDLLHFTQTHLTTNNFQLESQLQLQCFQTNFQLPTRSSFTNKTYFISDSALTLSFNGFDITDVCDDLNFNYEAKLLSASG